MEVSVRHQPYTPHQSTLFAADFAGRSSSGSGTSSLESGSVFSDDVEPPPTPAWLRRNTHPDEPQPSVSRTCGLDEGRPDGRGGNGSEPAPAYPPPQPPAEGQESRKAPTRWGPLPGCEEWEIHLGELFIGQRFATGTYGRLYMGCYKGSEVAVKFLVGPDNSKEWRKISKQFAAEVEMYRRCKHPNVLKFIGASQTIDSTPPSWCIVTEYLSGGNLKTYLRDLGTPPPPPLLLQMALDIAQGINYLHALGIVHRDLKPDNLLLSESGRVKVADLGVARLERQGGNMTAETGTYRWMAPEMIEHVPYTRKVDVYSFGLILWGLMTAQVPFEGMTGVQAAFAVTCKVSRSDTWQQRTMPAVHGQGALNSRAPHLAFVLNSRQAARPPLPTAGMAAVRDLICRCWDADPRSRPEFEQIVAIVERLVVGLRDDPDSVDWIKPGESGEPNEPGGRNGRGLGGPVGCMLRVESAPELEEFGRKRRWKLFSRMQKTFSFLDQRAKN